MIPAVYPLAVLGVLLMILVAARIAPFLRTLFCRWCLALFAVAAIVYGGGKNRFMYQTGLTDAGSYCTNDLIHAEWTWPPLIGDYDFRWQYRDATITNEAGEVVGPWYELPGGMVSDGFAEAIVPDATNMQVVCWAEYVPPIHVVTNGVYHLNGVMRAMGDARTNNWVTPGIRIIDGSRQIAPPEIRPARQLVP